MLCLDYVSRPQAFSVLYPKLLQGYALDALERLDREPAPAERVEAFVAAVAGARVERQRSEGLGEDVRLRGAGVLGSGLETERELIQLSAFTSQAARVGRIASPSRRR